MAKDEFDEFVHNLPPDTGTDDIKITKQRNKGLLITILIMLVIGISVLFFIFGAQFTCGYKSGGVLLSDMTCLNLSDLGYCLDNATDLFIQYNTPEGNNLPVPPGFWNQSIGDDT